MSYKFSIQTKAIPNDKVSILNYKRKGIQWEDATVQFVDVNIKNENEFKIEYRVILDRRSTGKSRGYPKGDAPIILTVSNNQIEKLDD